MSMTEIVSPTAGLIGYFHEVECATNDSILIFQLPRKTMWLSRSSIELAKETLVQFLPAGRNAIVIGADVNIYEIAGEDMLVLKLKGLI